MGETDMEDHAEKREIKMKQLPRPISTQHHGQKMLGKYFRYPLLLTNQFTI